MKRRLLLVSLLSVAITALGAVHSYALSGSDWRAGEIIDTGIFRNSTSMSPQQIQAFLNAKVPSCDTNGTQPSEYGGGTRAQYGTSRGYPPPYTCLKDYTQNGKSAAQIIYDYSQQYRINPQVLLTVLQKEQTLVTDDWPWSIQYRSATGYGCPDTAPCDSQYYGFDNQVRWAARMYQAISDNDPDWYSPYLPGNNFIQWHPNSGCGGSNVNILNRATAALYSYTPYQPNATALSNIYGSQTDGCSSYGNRNFWRLFNDWFGSTLAPTYSWSYGGQTIYTDDSKTTSVDAYNVSLKPGGRYYAVIKARNTGNQTWTKGNFRLGTTHNADRPSLLYDPSWITAARPATLTENLVAPGDVGTFEFWINIPTYGADMHEYFNPLQEGVTWLNDIGMNLAIRTSGTYSWAYGGQGLYTDNTKAQSVDSYSTSLKPGGKYYAVLKARNTGNTTWYKGNFRLGTSRSGDRNSALYDASWISSGRAATINEDQVAPGETGTFEFWVNIPTSGVDLREYFNPVQEGITWLNDIGMNYVIKTGGNYSWSYDGQALYTNSSKTTAVDFYNNSLTPGGRYYAVVKAKNTGGVPWYKGNFRLGLTRPDTRSSVLYDATWISASRPATLVESVVQPGEVGTFEFWINVPSSNVDLREYFNPLQEGIIWLNDLGMHYIVKNY